MTEKVFVVGGTGNIGERCVQQLLNNNVAVTLYTRSPTKVQTKFPQVTSIVEGDYNDLAPLEKGIQGHTRLFLLVADLASMPSIKCAIATKAYAAGVKQIVDISSLAVTLPWRSSFLGHTHRLAEEAILAIPQRKNYVALRPTMFMTNHLWIDIETIKNEGILKHTAEKDELEGWISNIDIGDLAAIVLQEPIEKHGDATYELTGCCITPSQRVAALSKVLDREIKYVQISPKEKYEKLIGIGMPHIMVMDLISLFKGVNTLSTGLPILLGREPRSFEEFLVHNKHVFQY